MKLREYKLCFALDADRFSLVSPTPIDIDLSIVTIIHSSLGEIVNGFAFSICLLVDGHLAITVGTTINNSMEVVPVAGVGAGNMKVINP